MIFLKQISLSLLIIILLQCTSCKQGLFKRFDNRYKYIGEYKVIQTINSYGFPECGEIYSSQIDTIIVVDFGKTDTTLNVLDRDVYLDSTGRYGSYHFSIRLWNDSISSIFMNGGLGCGEYIKYIGKK